MGGVIISPNVKKESVRINPQGDIINAKTKQVTQPVEPEFVPPVQAEVPPQPVYTAPQAPTTNAISVIDQIRQAKENLAQLEELKKLKIAEKEAELELLKQ